ncbi:hypothetical protein CERSUDRAFT_113545 [Gelatoporia subvermispora B]|uniref:ferric-chelate reductase (NADPH) n=1 Tax=Ceriporiopsis subvermispora (strain B) TaxID=914234 RepID=M2RHX0_CERS8|nr:hypothetical protein CERSUDRAFT_113545 [Gelatoporia subvermispora B]
MASQSAAATASLLPAYPTTPSYPDDLEWFTAYLTIHDLTTASWIYSYILWIAIAFLLLVYSLCHWAGFRGGYVGAYWSRWALRRRTWRKKHSLAVARAKGQPHRQPLSLPSNAQLLTLSLLIIAALAVAFAGPDYIAPGANLWSLDSKPTVQSRRPQSYDTSDFTPFQPQYNVGKTWWSSGNRTGLVAFALLPLCILLALKAPPFALFASPITIQLHFDKLAWLHQWTGRLVWFFSALHVAFWSVELAKDRRVDTGKIAYTYAWQYDKFLFGWTAFAVMTLLILLSLKPIRQRHYEAFYFLHILFVPLTLVMAALHHPTLWWWCWAALAIWIGERAYRLVWFLHTNGIFNLRKSSPPVRKRAPSQGPLLDPITIKTNLKVAISPSTPSFGRSSYPPPPTALQSFEFAEKYAPPPGFAYLEVQPGRTVRLRVITPGALAWAPGQHFLLRIPAITSFTSHPFTVASVCDEQASSDSGRELVFLIRAKNGWTRDLWDTVASLMARGQTFYPGESIPAGYRPPTRGVLLRTYVDGAYGTVARARWGSYPTVLIVCGGSGVSFGMSVLQYMCLCMAGRDGKYLGGPPGGYGRAGWHTTRVRFVWLVREFGHIQWCAQILRRCMAMVPFPELQVDIFVTNVKPSPGSSPPRPVSGIGKVKQSPLGQNLEAPTPQYLQERRRSAEKRRSRSPSVSSVDSSDAEDGLDLSYYTGNYVEEQGELGHEEHPLDLTNFEGEDDSALPGEAQFSLTVKREGKLRRASSRRASKAINAKQTLASRAGVSPLAAQSAARLLDNRPQLPAVVESRLSDEFDADTSPRTSAVPTPTSAVPLLTKELLDNSTTPLSEFWQGRSPRRESDTQSHLSGRSSVAGTHRPVSGYSQHSAWSDTHSVAALISQTDLGFGVSPEQLRLDFDEQQLQDVGAVAERARPGRPKLDRILADEIERGQGAVAVACCGPTSLNAVIRKTIAAQIDPARIRRGDMRGSITLISEDFGY